MGRKLSAADFEELDALREMNDAVKGPSFLMRKHWHETGYRRFARAGLVKWGDPPKGFTRKIFAGVTITDAGRAALAASRGKPRSARDPIRERARKAVAYAIRKGRLTPPSDLKCVDCGHLGSDRRHEYDHHRGYGLDVHLDVEPVCTLCHADRERGRRNG